MNKASSKVGFLPLPLELRLLIYKFAIGHPVFPNSVAVYLSFSLFNATTTITTTCNPPTSTPNSKLCRSGFRNGYYPILKRSHEYPTDATRALSLTCKQINLDLREEFHDGPVALKIIEDSFFSLCASNKLANAIRERPWLQGLEILRLDLTGFNVYSEVPTSSALWLKRQSRRFSLIPDPIKQGKTPLLIMFKEWKAGLNEQLRTPQVNRKPYDFVSLIDELAKLPRLQQLEIFICSLDIYEHWADPVATFDALHSLTLPTFKVYLKAYDPGKALTVLVESKAGQLVIFSSHMWPEPLLLLMRSQWHKRWRIKENDDFGFSYRN